MLVCGGMKDRHGRILPHHAGHAGSVADIEDDRDQRQRRMRRAQLLLDVENGVLTAPQQHQPRRLRLGQLPAQLRPDRPASAGDEHRAPRYERAHSAGVGVDGLSLQQVFNTQLTQRGDAGVAGDLFVQRRHGARVEPSAAGELHDVPERAAGGRRHGDDHMPHSHRHSQTRHIGDGTEHPQVSQHQSLLGAVVVQKAHRAEAAVRLRRQFPCHHLPRRAGTHHQCQRPVVFSAPPFQAALEEPQRHARCRHGHRHEQGVQRHHRNRHALGSETKPAEQHEPHHTRHGTPKQRRRQHALQIGHTRKGPQPPVQP